MSISSNRCHLKQLSTSHPAIHTDVFALCYTTFPRGPTLSESESGDRTQTCGRERNRNSPLCHSFFPISVSIHPPPPLPCCYVLMCLIILLRDMSRHTHMLTHTCKQIHTLIITLRDMSTLSLFSRGLLEAFMHIKQTLFLFLINTGQ